MDLLDVLKVVRAWGFTLLLTLTPFILAFTAVFVQQPERRCCVVLVIMAILWITEAIPLAATALIPIFALPLLGLMPTSQVCQAYFKDTSVMFMGGLMMAVAVEHTNLHKRIALFVILRIGESPRLLMAGFMIITTFLSMWTSNTAVAAMMVPVLDAVVLQLAKTRRLDEGERVKEARGMETTIYINHSTSPPSLNDIPHNLTVMKNHNPEENGPPIFHEGSNEIEQEEDEEEEGRKKKENGSIEEDTETKEVRHMLFLSVAFAANIGGTGSPLGCGPNIVLMGLLQSNFSEHTGLNFATWLVYNFPGMVVCGVMGWVWLQVLYGAGCRKTLTVTTTRAKEAMVRGFLLCQHHALGPLSRREAVVLASFTTLILLWLFRAPGFVTGWAHIFQQAFGEDMLIRPATPAMLMVLLLFCIPARYNKSGHIEGCLTWEVVSRRVPWGAIILLGGGLAMAEAANATGLSVAMGQKLEALKVLPKEVIVLVLTCLATSLTELASNTATASILLPVIKNLAVSIEVHPLYLLIPTTTCCAFAFMLPVATPGNTIILTAARMNTYQMMRAGVVMNVLCVLVVNLLINTLGVLMFDLNTVPPWLNSTITTT